MAEFIFLSLNFSHILNVSPKSDQLKLEVRKLGLTSKIGIDFKVRCDANT